jgi:hypothetical protein
MKKESKFALFIIIVIVLLVGIGVFTSHVNSGPSKFDGFAQALKTDGAQFYGAFWCPHCQAEKALFGSAVKYLPYVECSNSDRTQTKVCTDAKVESYPTWKFKNGITLMSKGNPTVCSVAPATAGEPAVCLQVSSTFYKTWIFPEYSFAIKSATDPVHTGDTWKFPTDAATTGEIPLAFLAQQIGYTLPK